MGSTYHPIVAKPKHSSREGLSNLLSQLPLTGLTDANNIILINKKTLETKEVVKGLFPTKWEFFK